VHARAKLLSVADGVPDFRFRIPDDDGDVRDSGVADGLDGVEQNGLVRDGYQLLGAGVGDGPEARPLTARENECFDGRSLPFGARAVLTW
jgi:hypothetical protein